MDSKFMAKNLVLLRWVAIINLIAISSFGVAVAVAFTPKAGSPLETGSHPRLLITQENIPAIRAAIASRYLKEYQKYVNWTATETTGTANDLVTNNLEPFASLMIHQAFVSAIGVVPGINYPLTPQQIGRKAVDRYLLLLRTTENHLGYPAALVYDWAHPLITAEERAEIGSLILNNPIEYSNGPSNNWTLANPRTTPLDTVFSSGYMEGFGPFLLGLAFWGDGIIDAEADAAVNSFNTYMLNGGGLDAQNFLAGKEGGFSEWPGYARHHPRSHYIKVDGWRTATGEDYISGETFKGNAIKTYPELLHYVTDPHFYFSIQDYSFMQIGYCGSVEMKEESLLSQMHFLQRPLRETGLSTQAGLLQHFINTHNVDIPHNDSAMLYLFLGLSDVEPVTPEAAGLAKSRWFKNLGAFFARTGFSSPSDTVFYAAGSHFYYAGHKGAWHTPGFGLSKFGELVNRRSAHTKDGDNLDNYVGGQEMNLVYFDGAIKNKPDEVQSAANVRDADAGKGDFEGGGIEQVTVKQDYFYHVRSDYSRSWLGSIQHSRELVWIPGSNSTTDSDFLVIYDRTLTPSNMPRWIFHVPAKPEVSGQTSTVDLTTGTGETDRTGTAFLNATSPLIKEFNGRPEAGLPVVDEKAHGAAFCKTLLPAAANVELTRVSKFNHIAQGQWEKTPSKIHAWQVDVIPSEIKPDHRFLHVFETADANIKTNMTVTSIINAGEMQGAWIEKEKTGRPNYVVLFNQKLGNNTNTVVYTITGNGAVRHVVNGIKPGSYRIEEDGQLLETRSTESNVNLWDYRGVATNTLVGTLYFESTASGTHTYTILEDSGSGTPGDSDGDGLPDSWEINYFGSIDDPRAQPSLDPDGDGFLNSAELAAATSPVESSSRLAILNQIFPSGSSFQIEWQSILGKDYEVQSSSDMTTWTTLETVPGSAGTTVWTDPFISVSVKKFYRIKVP